MKAKAKAAASELGCRTLQLAKLIPTPLVNDGKCVMRVVTSVKSEHILISFAASRLFEDVLSSVAIAVASANVESVQNYEKQTGDSQPKASGKGEGEACSKSQNESKGSEGLHRQARQSIVQCR